MAERRTTVEKRKEETGDSLPAPIKTAGPQALWGRGGGHSRQVTGNRRQLDSPNQAYPGIGLIPPGGTNPVAVEISLRGTLSTEGVTFSILPSANLVGGSSQIMAMKDG